jgi:multidrug efflux system membrane fusion protein
LVVVTQIEPVSVVFTLAEDDIARVAPRLRTGARLHVAAYDRANAVKLADGVLDTIDNQIDTTTGTVKLRALFANPDGALFPNQFVNARLLVNTLTDVVLVPAAALQSGTPGAYVYVVNADNTVSLRTVRVGASANGRTAVLEGIAAGDRVVVDGADRLRDGASVRLADYPVAERRAAPGERASGRAQP